VETPPPPPPVPPPPPGAVDDIIGWGYCVFPLYPNKTAGYGDPVLWNSEGGGDRGRKKKKKRDCPGGGGGATGERRGGGGRGGVDAGVNTPFFPRGWGSRVCFRREGVQDGVWG